MIRPAKAGDIPAIYQLIRDLAEYEHALPEVTATQQDLAGGTAGDMVGGTADGG